MVKSEEVNQFLKASWEWEALGSLRLLLVQRKRKELLLPGDSHPDTFNRTASKSQF
jgi:hypothetical protein